jgi:cytochrome c biogenesis protein CcdA
MDMWMASLIVNHAIMQTEEMRGPETNVSLTFFMAGLISSLGPCDVIMWMPPLTSTSQAWVMASTIHSLRPKVYGPSHRALAFMLAPN